MRPRLLDLFCGAGGCAVGYHRAGFDVTGVDHRPQPRYPFAFVRADALEYLADHGREFDVIHASPPCQRYSRMTPAPDCHPDLIGPCRELLGSIGKPWIMENVAGSPLRSPTMLCGSMFGLRTYRHRHFEASFLLLGLPHHPHRERCLPAGRGVSASGLISVAGNIANMPAARRAMGIDWMTRAEISQAVPPAYTEFIGRQLIDFLTPTPEPT